MIRVAVVDDEPLARNGVLTRLRAENDVEVVAECADGHALSELRRCDVDVAHDSFALRAFELDAVDYLLKPIDDERFCEAIDRVRRALGRVASDGEVKRFPIRIGSRTRFVDVDDIVWIEADGDYVALHADGHRYLLRESLYELSHKLDHARFLRVHRCAIVRVDQVAELMPRSNRDAVLRLRDGTTLRASRTYIGSLLAALSLSVAGAKASIEQNS
jgi:two-component system LytT family response regulator